MAATSETRFYARVDIAERIGAYIEEMAGVHGDAPITDAELAEVAALFGHDEPEPPSPGAGATAVPFPTRRPFDRAAHCHAIAASGGARTAALYGHQHFRIIGKAGKAATVAKYGYGHWLGIVQAKGWTAPRRPNLAVDLALGAYLADAA